MARSHGGPPLPDSWLGCERRAATFVSTEPWLHASARPRLRHPSHPAHPTAVRTGTYVLWSISPCAGNHSGCRTFPLLATSCLPARRHSLIWDQAWPSFLRAPARSMRAGTRSLPSLHIIGNLRALQARHPCAFPATRANTVLQRSRKAKPPATSRLPLHSLPQAQQDRRPDPTASKEPKGQGKAVAEDRKAAELATQLPTQPRRPRPLALLPCLLSLQSLSAFPASLPRARGRPVSPSRPGRIDRAGPPISRSPLVPFPASTARAGRCIGGRPRPSN